MTSKSSLPGLKEMLIGGVGTGKTYCIKTWLEAGIRPYCVFTEPSFEVLGDSLRQIDYEYLPPANTPLADMITSAKQINMLTMKGLSNLDDINKTKHQEFIRLLELLNKIGIDSWGTDRVLVLDSLSGLNIMAMNLVVGSKPVKSMSDWGIAMDNEERLIQKLCTGLRCHFQLTAHAEPERDEQTGQTFIMAATLGRKLAPRLPRFFSDVILAKREGGKFTWSTVEMGTDLKARNLPWQAGLPPTFVPAIDSWKSRGGIIEAAP